MRKNNSIAPKKLNLQTQTVRELDSRELDQAAGAVYRYTYFSCSYCTSCWK